MNLLLIYVTCLLSIFSASSKESGLYKADSLFQKKKYTEAFSCYETIFKEKKQFSHQMLLKMSFIQEGLKNYGESIYYLTVLQNHSPNLMIQQKINTLANKENLEGYGNFETEALNSLSQKFQLFLLYFCCIVSISSGAAFLVRLFYYHKKSYWLLGFCILFSISYGFAALFGTATYAISTKKYTYVMREPSSASDVITILEKSGHRFKILDKKDVWYKVELNNLVQYIHESNLKIIP